MKKQEKENSSNQNKAHFKIYPSIYKLEYNDISHNSSNTFILESFSLIDIDLWKKSFIIDSSQNISIDNKNLSKLIIDVQKSINGFMNYYGKSFSKQHLQIGNFYQYYMQHLAQFIFGHPSATEPFKNNTVIKKHLSNIIDSIIDTFYDNKSLKDMICQQFLKNDIIEFNENDIIQFKITLKPPDIFITKIHQLQIPTTYWYIILRMNTKI